MFAAARQTLAVTWMNLSNLGSRLGSSAVVVVGMAGVVAVLLGLLAMSAGIRQVLAETAQADRGLVLRHGSGNEMDGWISTEEMAILETHPGFAKVSGETYATLNISQRDSTDSADVVARGITDAAFELRPEVQIVAGRRAELGKNEVIVGIGAAAEFAGLQLGDAVPARGNPLAVVGHFSAQGTAVESEIWMDLAIAQGVFRRTGVSLLRVQMQPGSEFAQVDQGLKSDPRLTATLISEPVFFAEQSRARAAVIETFAYLIAGIMALGSVMAALNTMYNAVSRRTREIATLRALGFGNGAVVVSVLAEAMLLSALGAACAIALVYLALDGMAASTRNDAAGSQLAFVMQVTPQLMRTSLVWALVVGLLGGLLPAVYAARLPIAHALRSTG